MADERARHPAMTANEDREKERPAAFLNREGDPGMKGEEIIMVLAAS